MQGDFIGTMIPLQVKDGVAMKRWLKSLTILAVLFLILGIFIQSVYADKEELEKIKKAIKEKGAKWTAEENSISKLPKAERDMLLGTILSNAGPQGSGTSEVSAELPGAFDKWRSLNLVTPVKNQGGCGSCWAFACVAQVEFFEMQLKPATAMAPPAGKLSKPPAPSLDYTDLSTIPRFM